MIKYLRYLLVINSFLLAYDCSLQANPINLEQNTDLFHNRLIKDSCPESNKSPDKVLLDVNKATDTSYVDLDREIKDFSTSIVVKEFFNSKDTLFRFMKLAYGTIKSDLDDYKKSNDLEDKAVSIIFKGGNILRIIAHQIFSFLPFEAKNLLQKHYDDFFKRSDIDFSIIIDENRLRGLDYKKTIDELTNVTYRALNKIRKQIEANPENYFNLFQLKHKLVQKDLQQYFEKLNKLEAVKDPENTNWYKVKFSQLQFLDEQATKNLACNYEGQYDYRFDFDSHKEKIIGKPISKDTHWIMNTINTTLGWPFLSNPEKFIRFHLVRSKVQFELSYLKDNVLERKPIGAELLDVSIPLREDDNLKEIIKNYDNWIADFNFTLEETGESIELKGESLAGLAADIYGILFTQYERPWESQKYEKRMNRLFFLSIVEILGGLGFNSPEAKAYLEKVQGEILDKITPLFTIDKDELPALVEKLLAVTQSLANEYPKFSIANRIWNGMSSLVNKIVTSPGEGDEKNFNEILSVIEENLAIMKQLSQMNLRKINIDNIYDAKMSRFF